MINLKELFERIEKFYLDKDKKIKIPYTEGTFKRKTDPPHLAFTDIEYDYFNADDCLYFSKVNSRLELTILDRDRKLEKRLEKEILNNINFKKEITYIESEMVWNISYFFYLKEE